MQHSVPKISKPTVFAKKVQKLLEKELSEQWKDFDPKHLHYSGLNRAHIGVCSFNSILSFCYITHTDHPQRWLDVSVGLVNKQSELKGALYLVEDRKADGEAADYSVYQLEDPPLEKATAYVFESSPYETALTTLPITAAKAAFYGSLREWHPELQAWSDIALHNTWFKYSQNIYDLDFVDWADRAEPAFLGFLYVLQEHPNFSFSSLYNYEVEIEDYALKQPWKFDIPNPSFLNYTFD